MADKANGGHEVDKCVPSDSVIASSDRQKDIHPYCDVLYQTEPHKWGGMMPQDYPVNPSRQQEEEFLRQWSTEDEIRMQGGAHGDGNGFRFLKQVWWSIALYNFCTRIPHMVDWWLKTNPEIVQDPSMVTKALSPDATYKTIFTEKEILSCGEKFLVVATRAIQWTLRNPGGTQPSSTRAATSPTTSASQLLGQTSTVATFEGRPASRAVPLPLKPTAHAFDVHGSPVDLGVGSQDASAQIRNLGDGNGRIPEHRQPQKPKRGSYKKRGSIHDRSSFRSGHDFHDTGFVASPAGHGPPPQAFIPGAPFIPPSQGRMPSFGAMPNAQEFMAGAMPGACPPAAYGPAMPGPGAHLPQQEQLMMPVPAGYGGFPDGAFPPPYRQAQPLGDRTNGKYLTHGPFDGQKARGESVTSRGGKRGGHAASGARGNKSSRGRNSVGRSSGDARLSLRHSSNDFNTPIQDLHPADRRFSFFSQDNLRQDSWRCQNQDENAIPNGTTRFELQRPTPAPPHSHEIPYVNRDAKWLAHNCGKDFIGQQCTYVNKLIIFKVPKEVPQTVMVSFFANFGPVQNVARQDTPQNSHRYPEPLVYVNFDPISKAQAARACLDFRGESPWGPFRAEVPREYWDTQHDRFSERDSKGKELYPRGTFWRSSVVATSVPESVPSSEHHVPPPTQSETRTAEAESQPSPSHKATTGSEDVSEDHTPTASGSVTPNPKKAKGKKNKKNKKTGVHQDCLNEAFKANAQKSENFDQQAAQEKIEEGTATGSESHHVEGTDTPMRASPILEEAPHFPEVAASGAPITLAATADAIGTSAQSFTHDETSDHDAEPASSNSAKTQTDVRAEDEHVEDSFHTASGTPTDVEAESADTGFPANTSASPQQPVLTVGNNTVHESNDSTPPRKETKIAPIPQISPSSAIPSFVQTTSVEKTLSDEPSPEVYSVLDTPTGEPAAAEIAPKNAADPASDKKPVKPKGPAQTESFGAFSSKQQKQPKKKKKPKKPIQTGTSTQDTNAEVIAALPASPKTGDRSGYVTDGPPTVGTRDLPEQAAPMPLDTNAPKTFMNRFGDFLYGSQPSSLSSLQPPRSHQHDVLSFEPLTESQKIGDEACGASIESLGAGASDKHTAPDSVKIDPAIFAEETPRGTFVRNGAVPDAEGQKRKKKKSGKNGNKANKHVSGIDSGSGTDIPHAPLGEAVVASEKKAKGSNMGETLKMNSPAQCNESKSPIDSLRGRQAVAGTAQPAPAQSSSSPTASPARNFNHGQAQHLITAAGKPMFRQHKRIRSNKSSDSTSSGDEKALSVQKASDTKQSPGRGLVLVLLNANSDEQNRDAVQKALGARFPDGQEAVGLVLAPSSKREMPYVGGEEQMLISEEVKKSIARQQEMELAEKKVKESKAGKAHAK